MKAWPAYNSDDKSHSDFWEHVVLRELWMNDTVFGLVSEPHFVDDGLEDRVPVEALAILCVLEDVWECWEYLAQWLFRIIMMIIEGIFIALIYYKM